MKQSLPKPVREAPVRTFEPVFVVIAKQLIAAGRQIPAPLRRAVDGEYMPLALSTREDWPAWASLNDYDAEQLAALMRALSALVRHPGYLEALAADLAQRVDYDGKAVDRVAAEHRLAAALMLHRRELHKARQ